MSMKPGQHNETLSRTSDRMMMVMKVVAVVVVMTINQILPNPNSPESTQVTIWEYKKVELQIQTSF